MQPDHQDKRKYHTTTLPARVVVFAGITHLIFSLGFRISVTSLFELINLFINFIITHICPQISLGVTCISV
ncbi:unnamed protein product [Trichobilharzia szidati]|nr:unnamed protein product [Trichobilharzia szidati]